MHVPPFRRRCSILVSILFGIANMDIDKNFFYRLTSAAAMKSQLSLAGPPSDLPSTERLVTSRYSDNDDPMQQWQIFPISRSTVILRTKASGPNGYLAAARNKSMTPYMLNRPYADSSMLWTINPWGDGTFYLSSVVYGKACHLGFERPELIRMSTNITQPQPGQAFSFVKLKRINNPAYSTVRAPPTSLATPTSLSKVVRTNAVSLKTSSSPYSVPALSTEPASPTITSLSQAPTTIAQPQSTSQRFSLPTAMGLGVAIGALGFMFLTAISLYVYQRWIPHQSSIPCRCAKSWDQFTSATATPAMPFMASSPSADKMFIAELPVNPAAGNTPIIAGAHIRWFDRASWLDSPCSPLVETDMSTLLSPPSELPG